MIVKKLEMAMSVAFCVTMCLMVAGCSPSRTSDASIVIGAVDPQSGPFAAYGEPVRDGMLLAVEEINAGGGILGRKVELALEDDAGDPKTAVSAFTKLATATKVPVVIGPLSSGASMATAPLADKYKVVQLSTLAGTIDLTNAGDYVFRIYPSSEVGSRYIAKEAVERFSAKRAAILYPNNPFGVTSNKFVGEVMKERGVAVVAAETFNDGDRDFRTQLTKIIEAKPDVLLCSAYYEEGAQILVQAKQLGLSVPILGEDGWFGPIAQIAGDALKNLYFANVTFGPEIGDNKIAIRLDSQPPWVAELRGDGRPSVAPKAPGPGPGDGGVSA
jgi:branched-chain amino acid transport system substrate-binding protein